MPYLDAESRFEHTTQWGLNLQKNKDLSISILPVLYNLFLLSHCFNRDLVTMFDDLAYLAPGGHENSQRLLLQALWSLEDASECHDKLIQKAKKLSRGPTAFELDASVVGLSMKRALSDLSLLHLCLFKGQFLDEFETFCGRRPKARRKPKALVWKPRPRLHREDALQGRPGLDPRILQLKSLVKYNILNSSQLLGSSIVQKDSLTIRYMISAVLSLLYPTRKA